MGYVRAVGFRDDQLAGQERAQALEREVERLRAENAELRRRSEEPAESRGHERRGRLPTLLGLIGLGTGVAAVVAPLPPQARLALALCSVVTGMLALTLKIVGSLLHVVEPGELLVLSGRSYQSAGGGQRGYRIVTGGRVLQVPIVERAEWMSVGPFPFTLELRGAFASNGPIRLSARGAVAIGTRPEIAENAVERFLGRRSEEIVEVARQSIESALRAVVARLSLRELQEDAHFVARKIAEELESDLAKLGLELPTFVIDEVSDAREG